MIRLAASNTPEQAAWAAFDEAAMRLSQSYRGFDQATETDADRVNRRELAIETARLWEEWRTLFLAGDDGPRPAA